ncbi:MAG: GGGtGRT protein [Acutalibacteraceae bacterium]
METEYNFQTGELNVVSERAFSDGERALVKCYGADDVLEGVAIMKHEGVDVSITGNSTNPTRSNTWLQVPIRSGQLKIINVILCCFRRWYWTYFAS